MAKPPAIPVSKISISAIRFQARQFAEAARRCIPDPMLNGVIEGPTVPGVVCASFALELWFKALLCAAKPTGNLESGHDLSDLFKKLNPDVQKALIARCTRTESDVNACLAEDAKVFMTWRYSYEHGALETGPINALSANTGLMFSLFEACDEVDKQFYRK